MRLNYTEVCVLQLRVDRAQMADQGDVGIPAAGPAAFIGSLVQHRFAQRRPKNGHDTAGNEDVEHVASQHI